MRGLPRRRSTTHSGYVSLPAKEKVAGPTPVSRSAETPQGI